ncbi:MarR family transcriptional regulator [Actinomadura sp. ATCC 31491]|uniref:MarR family transcriptional regulator n=1 Tax=Actinomadura luzonensis TaxID=2805427 RepID=A0ABT0FM89_9ACTN|nr:MarR family transcriptional regulator [Actinomadura luzonensis]MCK2213381.1 MarR family transcriptional regulator [Actinomadura luzonensis]
MAATEPRPAGSHQSSPLSPMLCFDLYAASRGITSVYRGLLEPLGLTYPQYLVLVLLWQHESRTVRELGEELRLDYNTLSPLLKRLEAHGLLSRRRRPDDERSVEVTLTAEGRAMQERCGHVPAAISQAMGIDEETIAELQHAIRRITASTAAYAAAPPG